MHSRAEKKEELIPLLPAREEDHITVIMAGILLIQAVTLVALLDLLVLEVILPLRLALPAQDIISVVIHLIFHLLQTITEMPPSLISILRSVQMPRQQALEVHLPSLSTQLPAVEY